MKHFGSLIGLAGIFAASAPMANPDFSTPEGAILALESAYRAGDIDAAVSAKNFRMEARLMLEGIAASNGAEDFADDELIARTAEVLELAYRQTVEAQGFPDMSALECSFPSKREVAHNLVEVTERCHYPDGTHSEQRILVGRTASEWRVLNPVPEAES